MEIPRRVSCLCGSGRPYKHCCERMERHERELSERVFAYAMRPPKIRIVERTLTSWGFDPEEEDDSVGFSMAVTNAIHDHRDHAGHSIFQNFVREEGRNLSEGDRALLQLFDQGRWGLFEVTAVHPEKDVSFQALDSNETYLIRDYSASVNLRRWQLVFTRIQPGRGAWVGSSGLMVFDPDVKDELLTELARKGLKSLDSRTLARRAGEVYHAISDIVSRPPFDKVVTPEGDVMIDASADWKIPQGEQERVGQVLAAREDVIEAESDEVDERVFNWARPEGEVTLRSGKALPERGLVFTTFLSELDGGDSPRERKVNLATFRIGDGHLHVECVSETRLDRAVQLVTDALPELPTPQRTVRPLDLDQASEELEDDLTTPEEESPVPSEIAESIRHKMAQNFLTKWPGESVPGLDGKTPKEAAMTPSLRPRLVDLLKHLEIMTSRGGGVLDMEDVARLAHSLGVTELDSAESFPHPRT